MSDKIEKIGSGLATVGELIAYRRQVRGQKPFDSDALSRRFGWISWLLNRAGLNLQPVLARSIRQIETRPAIAVAAALGLGILTGQLLRPRRW